MLRAVLTNQSPLVASYPTLHPNTCWTRYEHMHIHTQIHTHTHPLWHTPPHCYEVTPHPIILPQLGRPTSAPAHWLTGHCVPPPAQSALCPTTHHAPEPSFYATATLCSSYMHSHFNHIYMYILPQISLTNRCLYVASLLYIACLLTVVLFLYLSNCSSNTFFALLVRACK
jgi:hypothetical protein